MILLAAFALAVVWGLVRGGSLVRVSSFPLQASWMALVAFALQVYLLYFPEPRADSLLSPQILVLAASYALLFGFVWKNRALPGMWIVGIGLIANCLVMLSNGGYMPITREALAAAGHLQNALGLEDGARVLRTKDIILAHDATQLWFLSDIFIVPPPFPIPSVFSIGDALIASGVFLLVQRALGRRNPGDRQAGARTLANDAYQS